MRLRSFSAPTMAEAMRQLRQTFGADAIIVSTQRTDGGRGVRITAALESPDFDDGLGNLAEPISPSAPEQEVRAALAAHGTPERVVERLAGALGGGADPVAGLAGALTTSFEFDPLPNGGAGRPLALVGPHGAGKTVTVAKLASRAVLDGQPVRVITTDTFRAGGIDQLSAITKLLEIELHTARTADQIARAAAPDDAGGQVFVDTAGVNPFSVDDLARLSGLVTAANAEPVLTLPAGGDAGDAFDIGEVFGTIGVKRLLITRLDAARRLGSVLAAAEGGRLAFSEVGASPHVTRGFRNLDPFTFARLLLSPPGERDPAGTSDDEVLQ